VLELPTCFGVGIINFLHLRVELIQNLGIFMEIQEIRAPRDELRVIFVFHAEIRYEDDHF
jgi:hypothetical protein